MTIEELRERIDEDIAVIVRTGTEYEMAIVESIVAVSKKFTASQIERIDTKPHKGMGSPDWERAMQNIRKQKEALLSELK